jgi:hypothetical protein
MNDTNRRKQRKVSAIDLDKGTYTGRHPQTSLVVASVQPDHEAVRSVIREWLVPLLVKEFLAEQQAVCDSVSQLKQESTFKPLGEERGEQTRTPSQ